MAAAAAVLAALSAAAPIAGAAGGWSASDKDRESADYYRRSMGLDLNAADPHITQGQFAEMGPSAYDDISVDPRTRDAQYEALRSLQQEGLSGGLSAQDRMRQAEAMQASQTAARGQREAVLANMAARGMGGSGAELAAQLSNQQNSASQMNQAGMQSASDANARALAAIAQGGALGGQMEAQQYGEAAKRADAQNMINQYNANQRTNAGLNAEQMQQQEFNNRLARANGYGGAAQIAQGKARDTMGMWAGIGQGAGQAFGAGAQFAGGGK